MKTFVYLILGLITAIIVYFTDLSVSLNDFTSSSKNLLSFSIVTLISGYAFYFIHETFQKNEKS